MLFFSLVIGLVSMLVSLETPVLEEAVLQVDLSDPSCYAAGLQMLEDTRDHAVLSSVSCLVDTLGALLAIRSKVRRRLARSSRPVPSPQRSLQRRLVVPRLVAGTTVRTLYVTVGSLLPPLAGAFQLRRDCVAACRGRTRHHLKPMSARAEGGTCDLVACRNCLWSRVWTSRKDRTRAPPRSGRHTQCHTVAAHVDILRSHASNCVYQVYQYLAD
jgi:hypothetical protein